MPSQDSNQIDSQPVIVTSPTSVAFLKSLYEQVGPGRLTWDFSRPNHIAAPNDGSMKVEAGILKYLKLKDAGLTGELTIDGAAGLDWLELSGNRLKTVEFKNMPKLGGFKIIDEHLSTLTLAGGLGRLPWEAAVMAPRLAKLKVNGRNRLSELYIMTSRLEDIEPIRRIIRLKELAILTVKSDRLTDLSPLAGSSFMDLVIASPVLSDLRPLSRLKHPGGLDITGALITDISPLVALRNRLRYLNIASPVLSDLQPLARLKKLGELGVFSDAVTDLSPLAGLNKLWSLVLEGRGMHDFSAIVPLEENLTWKIINGRQLKGGQADGEQDEEKTVE